MDKQIGRICPHHGIKGKEKRKEILINTIAERSIKIPFKNAETIGISVCLWFYLCKNREDGNEFTVERRKPMWTGLEERQIPEGANKGSGEDKNIYLDYGDVSTNVSTCQNGSRI